MFNKEKIQALEQGYSTLSEELTRANETITILKNTVDSLFENIEEIVGELNKTKSEKDELAKNFGTYAEKVSEEFKRVYKANEELASEIKEVSKELDELKEKSNNADAEHSAQIKTLCDNNDRLIAKCEELQLSNVQIMNEHRDMIKRYEESIKGYAEQTERMQNNVLKKMNANNIISVVEE